MFATCSKLVVWWRATAQTLTPGPQKFKPRLWKSRDHGHDMVDVLRSQGGPCGWCERVLGLGLRAA